MNEIKYSITSLLLEQLGALQRQYKGQNLHRKTEKRKLLDKKKMQVPLVLLPLLFRWR